MANEQLQWTAPEPFWAAAAGTTEVTVRRAMLQQPAILRFASDTFMDDFLQQLAHDPARLPEFAASPETWRGPAKSPILPKQLPAFARSLSRKALARERQKSLSQVGSTASSSTASQLPLKLYQPAHQRFYLVTSCLVCGRAGLPDHVVDPGKQERAGFVVRRLLPQNYKEVANDSRGVPIPLPAPDNSWDEYALVTAPEGHGWRKVLKPATATLVEGEDLLPLFPSTFTQDDGHSRRLFGGLIPVGKRESYVGAPLLPPPGSTTTGNSASEDDAPVDPRMMRLWTQVTEPWKRLLETADRVKTAQGVPPDPTLSNGKTIPPSDLANWIKSAREQIQTGSWYVLLDFTKYLSEYFPALWQVVSGAKPESFVTNDKEQKILTALKTTQLPAALVTALSSPPRYSGHVKATFADALKAIVTEAAETGLESVANSYVRDNPDSLWPGFLFPFADPTLAPTAAPLPTSIAIPSVSGEKAIDTAIRKIDAFANLIQDALPKQTPPPESSLPLVAQRPIDMREAWFQLRCIYERPECGPIDPPVVSVPTAPFQMANFFDPDAPARPIRIALPIDTSPAGLRKFDKNAAFVMSDMLCGQVNRMKGITLADLVLSVLPWPLHKDLSVPDGGPCGSGGLQLGMICSLSIPIITICALLLLIIIVFLLDFIFRWIPFFLICFPLPRFSAGKK